MDRPHKPPALTLATASDDTSPRAAPGLHPSSLPLYALSLLLLLMAVAGFVWHDLGEAYRDTLAYWDVRMSSSAEERARIAILWIKDRRAETEGLARTAPMARLLTAGANRRRLTGMRQEVEREIQRMIRINGFLGGAVGYAGCRIVAQAGVPAGAMEGVQQACREAQRAGDFRAAASGQSQSHVWLNLAFPVFGAAGATGRGEASPQELGAVVMIAEPWESVFFPFISPGSEPSRTTATLLVWKEAGRASVFLPHPGREGGKSVIRRWLSDPTFESRVAQEGNVGFGEFRDYRGVRVLAAARAIGPGLGSLARKVDKDDALAQFRQRERLEWLAGALSVLLCGVVIVGQHRHMATQSLKEKLAQQQALLDLKRHVEVSEERFRDLLESVEAIVWEADGVTLRVNFVSRGVEKILGYSPDQWIQTQGFWSNHLHPEDCERALATERVVQENCIPQVLEYRMVAADGQIRWFRDYMLAVRGLEGKARLLRGIMVDITESMEAEDALRESEQRYRVLFESAGDALLLMRGDTFVDCNQKAVEMFKCGRENLIGKTPTAFSPPRQPDGSDSQEAAANRVGLAVGGQTQHFEWRSRRPDGTLFDLEITLNRLELANEVLLLAQVRDISDRKRVEEELRASRHLLRTTLYSLRDAVFIMSLEKAEILECNPAATEIFGYHREELVGRGTRVLHVDETALREFRVCLDTAMAEKGYLPPFEFRMRRKDGTIFPTSHSVAPLRDSQGNQTGWVSLVQDITERKRAEKELQKLSRAVEQSPASVVITDLQGNIEYVNPKFTTLTGYAPEEAVGKNPRILKSHLTPAATYRALWDTVLSGGEWHGEFANKKKNGEIYWESASISPIKDAGGTITHFVAVKEDITERKRVDAELADRLHFETLLVDLSTRFVNVPADRLDDEIEDAQCRVCECLGLDMSTLWQSSEETPALFTLTHLYRGVPGPPFPEHMDAQESFPWGYEQLMTGKRNVIAFSSLAELPAAAARDREAYGLFGVKTALAIALRGGGRPPTGALSFHTTRTERTWPEETVKQLQLVAQVFSNALARQRSERALRESEERFRGLSNASLEGLMIHDQGLILDLNLAFARLFGYEQPQELIGKDGLECIIAPESREVIRQRMRQQEVGPVEVTCVRKDGTRFAAETDSRPVKYLGHFGTLVSCRDITERKRAQEELRRSLDQLRLLAGRLQSVREEERKSLAREIHDQLGQALTAIKLDLSSLVHEIPDGAPHLKKRESSILGLVDETIQAVRRISTELRPGILDDLGLVAAIEWAVEDFGARTGTKCRFGPPEEEIAVDSERATAIFRILQEALTNVARHAAASEVAVKLGRKDQELTLEVHDNGTGIDEARLSKGGSLGILGMQERALAFGGEVMIVGGPGRGTTVKVRIPETCHG